MYENRTLVRGDNLEEMRKFPDECIDLIATDPPFNSKRDYLFRTAMNTAKNLTHLLGHSRTHGQGRTQQRMHTIICS